MQDMALPQVLVLLVQHEMHNTAHIKHNNAYITQGNVVVLGCVENEVNKGIKIRTRIPASCVVATHLTMRCQLFCDRKHAFGQKRLSVSPTDWKMPERKPSISCPWNEEQSLSFV